MGIKCLTIIKDFWSSYEELRDFHIANILPRNRFDWSLADIHMNNNEIQSNRWVRANKSGSDFQIVLTLPVYGIY